MRRSGAFVALAFGAAVVWPTGPVRAHHNDWALPLLGGAVGGYALKSVLGSEQSSKAQPHANYAAPPAPPPQPTTTSSTASVEARLHELDTLAANGYITKQEYQQRRQAILDQL